MDRKDNRTNINLFHKINVIVLLCDIAAIAIMVLIGVISSIANRNPGPLMNLLYLLGIPGCFLLYFLLELLIDKVEADEERTKALKDLSNKDKE